MVEVVDYGPWCDETLQLARKIDEANAKQKREFRDALNEVIREIPVNKAILFVSLLEQGFFKEVFNYDPVLNLSEEDI